MMLYRCWANWSCSWDPDYEIITSRRVYLHTESYRVQKETPCGYWIFDHIERRKRWVSKTSRKRFAHPTREEAREGFRQRKLSHVAHARARLYAAERELDLVEKNPPKPKEFL